MIDIYARIDDALAMSGLKPAQIAAIKSGAPIYGDTGQVDSLGLVRLISAVSTGFQELDIDMFDMMADLDVEAIDAFADRESIHAFLTRFLATRQAAAV